MKKVLLVFFMFFCGMSFAQTERREQIEGNIKVPAGADSEGITIFNKNANRGSVSDAKGDFIIHAREGDSLYFAAVQFREMLVVVNEQMVKDQRLFVEITEGVNELPEVVIRDHDLSGNIAVDAKNIEVETLNIPAFSVGDLANWDPPADGQSAVENVALGGGGLKKGANPLAIIGMAVDLLVPEKPKVKKEPEIFVNRIELERIIREKYDDQFFLEVLKIEKKEISLFFDFCEAAGFPRELLNQQKEIQLIQYLLEQSELYRTG